MGSAILRVPGALGPVTVQFPVKFMPRRGPPKHINPERSLTIRGPQEASMRPLSSPHAVPHVPLL
jgi:hypothetical protein